MFAILNLIFSGRCSQEEKQGDLWRTSIQSSGRSSRVVGGQVSPGEKSLDTLLVEAKQELEAEATTTRKVKFNVDKCVIFKEIFCNHGMYGIMYFS